MSGGWSFTEYKYKLIHRFEHLLHFNNIYIVVCDEKEKEQKSSSFFLVKMKNTHLEKKGETLT